MTSLKALWTDVEESLRKAAGERGRIRFLETGVQTTEGVVLAGVGADGRRHLCIPAPGSELGQSDKLSRGVSLEVVELETEQGNKSVYVDVACNRPELIELFVIVADEMLSEVSRTTAPAFRTCQATLQRWRDLLEREKAPLLTRDELAALLAELILLERLTRRTSDAIAWWTGPEGGVHDFVCGNTSFEVKSSQRTTGTQVEVSDLAQLTDPPGGGELYLVFTRLRHTPGRGDSVPVVVDRILASGCDPYALNERLQRIGYGVADAPAYRHITFEVVEERLWRVDASFPRLTDASFQRGGRPAQVTKVRYTLQLDSPEPKPLGPAAVELLLNNLSRRKIS